MNAQPERKKYNLTLPQELYEEIEQAALEWDTTVVDVIKRFLRLGLVIRAAQSNPETDILLREKGELTKIRFW